MQPGGSGKFQFAIDRGGTFTDVFARTPNGSVTVLKLLSVDPANYKDAPTEGIRRIIEKETGQAMPAEQPVDTSCIEWIRMGTTVATNALLERKGERIALVITKGFKDLLYIGNQSRPKIFDLEIVTPEMLYEEVVEVEERLLMKQDKCKMELNCKVVTGITGEQLHEWIPVNTKKLRKDLTAVYDRGIRSLAIVLLHSYIYPDHEMKVEKVAKEIGFEHISLSSQVMPMVKIVPRGYTASADAYLTPCVKKYLASFAGGFKDQLQGVQTLFMQSDGGLTPMKQFNGARAILSGPAGGVVGYAMTTYQKISQLPAIGFDMGGTSTDVSRYAGQYEHVFESTTAGIPIQAPQLDVNTVAAGGGSILQFRCGLFNVGPESAGAHPGPMCYRKGGPLTVTDANLCLGRILPKYFPRIFGKTKDQPLDKDATLSAFQRLTTEVNQFSSDSEPMSVEEVAMGFIRVANEAMCRPIRALTQSKGYDTSRHILACFGGAGAQHACAIARSLGISEIFIHRFSAILSAYGMALADVVHEEQVPCAVSYETDSIASIDQQILTLIDNCKEALMKQGFAEKQISTQPFLHLRYEDTDCALMCSTEEFSAHPGTSQYGDFKQAFLTRYKREFGFVLDCRTIKVDDIRVRGTGHSMAEFSPTLNPATDNPTPVNCVSCYFEGGYQETNVYLLNMLQPGHQLQGPVMIIDQNSTIIVEPDCSALITPQGDVKISVCSSGTTTVSTSLDAIQLSIFSHQFMSIAEQMGRVLQRTAISTNIKERLDFSCALFGPDGGLVSNAPHIPVHLGAMQETVQCQMKAFKNNLFPGDVLLSNHPQTGGSHLPDLTVITPVFYDGESDPVFYVASRGHHADIGGISPGSMPPHSTSLEEEGAVFKYFKLVSGGKFQEEALTEALMLPAKYPGSSGTRNLQHNLSDLKAQVAANHKGIELVLELINYYSLKVVQAYMKHIQKNAEIAVNDMLRLIAKRTKCVTGATQLYAEDYMDDGSCIRLQVDINESKGTAVFDFTGTTHQVHGNCNAPRAITLSALIYCLRCMVGHNIPLNQGCLVPVKIKIPKGCILDPSATAAVVGGNVLTSQRIVDVVFKAFGTCAASQGCMNNITFGDQEIGYYETIAGGAGAGPDWNGRSGIHSHMTNTRITDAEILEHRYPVILKCFSLCPNTGGAGKFRGGDGVTRELLFRKDIQLSVLTERRVYHPYGLEGGKAGERGSNLLFYKDGRVVNLGSKTSVNVTAGDMLSIATPGGGGYGPPEDSSLFSNDTSKCVSYLEDDKHDDDDVDDEVVKKKKLCMSQPYAIKGSVHNYKLAQESA
ncbi:5-oxoprolinase-like [Argonauta hians]